MNVNTTVKAVTAKGDSSGSINLIELMATTMNTTAMSTCASQKKQMYVWLMYAKK